MNETKVCKRVRKRRHSADPKATSEPGPPAPLKSEEPRQPLSTLTIKIPPDGSQQESAAAEGNRPGLRRTPRRIILRIRKDFLFHNQLLKKSKRKNISAVKENMCCVVNEEAQSEALVPEQPVKKKRGRKPGVKSKKNVFVAPVEDKEKPPTRARRGRPPKYPHISPPVIFREEERLLPATEVLRAPGQPLPWNFSDLEGLRFPHFGPFQPSPHPPARILLSSAGSLHDAMRKPLFQIRQFLQDPDRQPRSNPSRPTVIFFKDPKAEQKHPNRPPLDEYQRARELAYLRMRYSGMINGASADYVHDTGHHIVRQTDGALFGLPERRGASPVVHDSTGSPIQSPNQPSIQSCDDTSNESSVLNKPFLYADTLNRELIVESIRVLYDLDVDVL